MVIGVKIDEARARSRTQRSSYVLAWTTGVMGFVGRADHARPRSTVDPSEEPGVDCDT